MNLQEVLRYPIVTEKTEAIKADYKHGERHSFCVHKKANKELIRQALRHFYGVKVSKVNIIQNPAKIKRFRTQRARHFGEKKAIVSLARGETMDIYSQK